MSHQATTAGQDRQRRPGLAARKRQLVRDELGEAALHLIARQGFDETTVDEIVADAGVSRRTFFRYFASKEDVIVELLGDLGAELVTALRGRPADEPVLDSLHRAMAEVMCHATDDHGPKPRRLTALILRTPSLRARYLARQDEWRAELVEIVVERAGSGAQPPSADALADATALVGVALVAFDLALRQWALAEDGAADESLGATLDRAFTRVRTAVAHA